MNDASRVRVSIVGVVVAALFCSLLARLWFLQLNENQTAVATIERSTARTVYSESPRGLIYDRNGVPLVTNRITWVIAADPQLRAMSRRHDAEVGVILGKLSELLRIDVKALRSSLDDKRRDPIEEAILAADVSPVARTAIAEGGAAFPHLLLEELAVRDYPQGDNAVQVLGYVTRVYAQDLLRHPTGYQPNDTIGRAGIEAVYEGFLRGVPSSQTVLVNPAGDVVGSPVSRRAGRSGYDVRLTIDAGLQAQAQRSLAEGIKVARSEYNEDLTPAKGKQYGLFKYRATRGAAIVLDATNGDVLALASNPTYDPKLSIGGFSAADWKAFNDKRNHYPLINWATTGLYAPGSTFKLVTAPAAIATGVRTLFNPVLDTGCYKPLQSLDTNKYCNAGHFGEGSVDLRSAITVSSDVYFYGVGDRLWGFWRSGDKANGYAIQNEARQFGFGSPTGIAVDESKGRIPDAEWRKRFVDQQAAAGVEPYKSNRAGYEGWNPGDNINLAVGQGDLVVTPLQLADAYAAFANGGTLWTPRLGDAVLDHGKVLRRFARHARGHVSIAADVRDQMMLGFQGVVQQPSPKGTAVDAFAGFPFAQHNVAGKTGTAQVGISVPDCLRIDQQGVHDDHCIGNTSWFAAMFGGSDPSHPRYVVVVMVEEGGRGGRIAAPIARQIIEYKDHLLPVTPIPQLTAHD